MNADKPLQEERIDTDLISIVVHDLKSPVSAARGFIDLVEQTGELNENQQHFMSRAHVALNRMEQMIASILDFVHLETGVELELEAVNLEEVIKDALDLLTDVAKQRNITLHVSTKKIICEGDKRLLGHVINNLLTNAIKYNKDDGEIWLNVKKEDDAVVVSVRDTGVGIPTDRQARIFERFYRAHKEKLDVEGTGLGLTITQSIIERHGGRIWFESVSDEGTTFTFSLPLNT